MKKLYLEDIIFEESSVIDKCGRIFHYNNKIYRYINREYVDNIKLFLESNNIDILFKIGLVETKIAEIYLDEYPLILEHKKIPFVTYKSEWIPMMLRDALIMICDLSIELAQIGYALKDIHPGNILFDKCKPIFIDFGSIQPIEKIGSIPYDGIRDFFIFPLWLQSKGFHHLASLYMKEHQEGVGRHISHKMGVNHFPISYDFIVKGYLVKKRENHKHALINFYRKLKKNSQKTKIISRKSIWSDYPQFKNESITDTSEYSNKSNTVYNILKNIEKGTLLDMAANKGFYSEMAANLGYNVVSFDNDESAVTYIYNKNKIQKKNILPLKINFIYPTPNNGVGLSAKTSFDRIKCDGTLVLAIIHHLVFSEGMNFEVIARIIDNYSIKYSIVEFIPRDDIHISKKITDGYDWYTIENFLKIMTKHFPTYWIFESSPEPRKIILFKK